MNVTIYTDGACSGNPGIGGWGVVILKKNENPIYINGGQLNTTNNQMELTAPIEALKKISGPAEIEIFTDSKYVKMGITEWIKNWKNNGWKTANKKKVKNIELWIELDELAQKFNIKWFWVKAHSSNELNNEVDELARQAANSI